MSGLWIMLRNGLSAATTLLFVACLSMALGLAFSQQAQAHNAQYTFETEAQERQFRQLINELRCPKCQNQSIADSDAPLALDLRERVYQMTMEGQSREEIIEFMRVRYGDFVHYKPPVNATTMILWAGPGAVLLIGIATVVVMTRSQQRKAVEFNADEEARLAALLDAEAKAEPTEESAAEPIDQDNSGDTRPPSNSKERRE